MGNGDHLFLLHPEIQSLEYGPTFTRRHYHDGIASMCRITLPWLFGSVTSVEG
jgi:hypothetical protein